MKASLLLISYEWIGAMNWGQQINNKSAFNYGIHLNLFLVLRVLDLQRLGCSQAQFYQKYRRPRGDSLMRLDEEHRQHIFLTAQINALQIRKIRDQIWNEYLHIEDWELQTDFAKFHIFWIKFSDKNNIFRKKRKKTSFFSIKNDTIDIIFFYWYLNFYI